MTVRARDRFRVWPLLAAALLCVCDKGAPAGSPCASALDCASGLCLNVGPVARVCVTRCATDDECASGAICGRFDFRGRDPDSGVLGGDPSDVVTVCRPSLLRPCDAACGPGLCVRAEGPSDRGGCSLACAADTDCRGRPCVGAPCGPRVCALPCDSIRECPDRYVCDLAHLDLDSHGRCLPIAPADAAVTADAACDTDAR